MRFLREQIVSWFKSSGAPPVIIERYDNNGIVAYVVNGKKYVVQLEPPSLVYDVLKFTKSRRIGKKIIPPLYGKALEILNSAYKKQKLENK